MSIKMPLKFVGNFRLVTRHGGSEKQEFCRKLSIIPFRPGKQGAGNRENSASFRITYFYFGCRRVLEGKLKEDSEEKVVFEVGDREMEFRPSH